MLSQNVNWERNLVSQATVKGVYKRYYQSHREQRLTYGKKHYREKRERILQHRREKYKQQEEYNQRYYQEHRDHILHYTKEYYESHREEKIRYTLEWQRRKKERCILKLGGKCQRCGYRKNLAALVFHHIDAKEKESKREWMRNGFDLSKGILLCQNCHEEVHYPELEMN